MITDFNINTTILVGIWIIAGLIALLPIIIKTGWKKYLVVPLVFYAVYVSFITNKEFLGTPIYDLPKGKFTYVHHSVSRIDGKKMITLWIRQKDFQRLYIFPYDKLISEKMRQARKSKAKGISMRGEFRRKKGKKLDETPSIIFELYKFPYQKVYPKY